MTQTVTASVKAASTAGTNGISDSRCIRTLLPRLNADRRSVERTDAADVDGQIRLNKGRWVGRIASAHGRRGAGQNCGWKCGGELYVDLHHVGRSFALH